ncbi:unnamed protein product [Meloidogyne enterolobii]|uniref:Uncharacterized protein n=1 Tax=Meloidogyne enterolobii TaxID=390850 RepID=A0ACB1AWG2_MELEN
MSVSDLNFSPIAQDKEVSTYRARSLSPFFVKNFEEEKSEEKKIIVKPSRKRGFTNTRTKRSRYTRPTSKARLTQQEEIKQQLSATYALIEAKKRKDWVGNIDETTNSSNDMEGSEGVNPSLDINLDDKPTCSKDVLNDVETGSDSTQIGLIDEDEARKIDMLLNSKAPEEEEENGHASEASADRSNTSTPSPATSDLLLINRPHRSRRPNTRYDIYENVGIVGSGEKGGRKQRSGTPKQKSEKTPTKQEPKSPEKTAKRTPMKVFSAGKRRILSHGTAERRMRQKRQKIPIVTSSAEAVHQENVDLTKVKKAPQAVTVPTTAAAALREFRDFVLPDSIKTDKSGSETPTEFSNGARGGSVAATTKQQIDRMLDEICGTDSNSANEEQSETPPVLTKEKQQFPSVITDRYKEELVLYTPRAKVLKETKTKTSTTSDKSSSHRKQNLNELANEEADGELSVLGTSNAKEKITKFSPSVSNTSGNRPLPPPKPKDLAQIPVYLTETQRDLFFKPLKPLFNKNVSSDGLCQCGECGDVRKNIKDGRRHMVSHIRVIRVRCSLCDAGAFFCSDMRVHLMYRYCEKLNLAPDEFVAPGADVPCMDKEKADMLTQLVDPYNPGRIMYSTGKIVSWTNPRPYYPDPKIERNILGPVLPGYVSSPHPSPKKKPVRSAILSSPKKSVSVTHSKELEIKKQESEQEKEDKSSQQKLQEGDESIQRNQVVKGGGETGESVEGDDGNNCNTTLPTDSNNRDHSYL